MALSMDACSKPVCFISQKKRDLKIPLSLSMGTCSEPVCLTSVTVKWPQQAVSLSVSPAVSLSVSPAGRRDSSFPWAMSELDYLTRHNLISHKAQQEIQMGVSIHYCRSLSSLSLNHTFLPNDKSLRVVSHHTTAQIQAKYPETFAFITFILNKSTK